MSKTASLVCRLICGPAGSMSEGGFWISGGVVMFDEDDEDCASAEEEFWARDGLGWRMPEARRVSARSCGASARRLREDCIDKGLAVSLRKRRKRVNRRHRWRVGQFESAGETPLATKTKELLFA